MPLLLKLSNWFKTFKIKSLNYLVFIILLCNFTTTSSQLLPESVRKYEDSIVTVLTIAKNDSQKVDRLYALARKVYKHDYDKGLKYINKSIELAKRIGSVFGEANGHTLKGIIFYYSSNHDTSLKELFMALSLAKQLNKDSLNATVYNWIGNNYLALKDFEKAKTHYEKSLYYYTIINDYSGAAMLNNNIGLLFYNRQNYDTALHYYKKALPGYKNLPRSRANTMLNIIMVHLKKGELEFAKQKIDSIESFQDKIGNFLVIAELHYTKGLYYLDTNDISKAVISFEKSIKLSSSKRFWNLVELSSKELSKLYDAKGEYKKALQYYKQLSTAKDSLINVETQKRILQLEIQNNQDKYVAELKLNQKQKQMYYLLYLFTALVLCLIVSFLYYRQRKKIKQRKKDYQLEIQTYQEELQNSSKEKTKLEYELAFKNNELTNFALQIIQNDEFIQLLRKKIKIISSKLKKEDNLKMIDDLDIYIRQSLNLEKSRNEFYVKTKSLHKTFLFQLKKQFPDLSSKEVELSLLLRLGYSSKEISSLINISSKSVDMARYRLRKKIHVASHISLTDFFNSFDS